VDITHGEHVEKELALLITRRDAQRRQTEGERLEEELWRESERRHAEHRREANRVVWCEHYRHMRAIHWGLGAEYDRKLKGLEETA